MRNNRGYLDGALYHNNPVRVADLERRLIWPDTDNLPPDILLSIGTSCNNSIRDEAQQNFKLPKQRTITMSPQPRSMVDGSQSRILGRGSGPQPRKLINILMNRVGNILDTEMTWLTFISEAARGDHDDKTRYHRINPNIGEEPPKMDEIKKLSYLRQRMTHVMKGTAFHNHIGEIARRLVASSFYVEIPSKPTSMGEFDSPLSGTNVPPFNKTGLMAIAHIRCRFPSDSQEIRYLGDYLKNVTTMKFTPKFVIGEKDSKAESQEIRITLSVIDMMMHNASFELGMAQILVSNEYAVTTVALSMAPGETLPISGFPRTLMARKIKKGTLPTH